MDVDLTQRVGEGGMTTNFLWMHNLSPVITLPPNFRYPAYVPGHRAYIFIYCVG